MSPFRWVTPDSLGALHLQLSENQTRMANTMKIEIAPEWDELERIRLDAADFLEKHGFAEQVRVATVMVLSELLENSVKYGSFTHKTDKVSILLDLSGDHITVEVTNPIAESSLPNLDKLDKTIQWVRGFQDPFEAYVKRLREISKKPLDDKESGLGIVRIAYEGKVALDFFVSDKDLLTVSAVRNI